MINYKKTSADLVILFVVAVLSTSLSIAIGRIFAEKEKHKIITTFNQKIEQRDCTIKILRDSLALDSVLVIIGSQAKIKSDSTGDSMIVSFGDINLRQWKKK